MDELTMRASNIKQVDFNADMGFRLQPLTLNCQNQLPAALTGDKIQDTVYKYKA